MLMAKVFISFLFLTNVLNFEVAQTAKEKEVGMMYRKTWGKIDGMLFINDSPVRVCYWMKNTYLPMTMWFMDNDLGLLESYTPAPLSTALVTSSNTNVRFVLEIKPELTNTVIKNYALFRKRMQEQLAGVLQ